MQRSYQRWTVRGYMRRVVEWTSQGVPFDAGYSEPVVVVFDPRGWEWQVTAEDGRVTSLTVRGERVDAKAMRVVPLSYLSEVGATYLGHVEQAVREGIPLSDALDDANLEAGQVRLSGDTPTPKEFAESWHATKSVELPDGKRVTRRQHLAESWQVSPYTIDKWTRAARDAGLIPPTNKGRPRLTKRTGSDEQKSERKQK
jgi:hypothetical protein